MKKFLGVFIGLFAALSLTACSNNPTSAPSAPSVLQSRSESSSAAPNSTSAEESKGESSVQTQSDSSDVSSNNSAESASTESKEETNPVESSVATESAESSNENVPAEDGKVLVAYFSWSGTSEKIAKSIIANTGADEFRIERETAYSDDYNTVAYGEAKDEADNNARPPIKNPLTSIDEYDKIVLCYPIWWHTCPMTVGTFLNAYDFSGKTVYPISQSASMSVEQFNESVQFVKDNAANAEVAEGIYSKDQGEIDAYLASNGIG